MRYLLNAQQMKACDQETIEHFKVPSEVLMERAALAVRDVVLERYPDARKILVVCGSGNNGGDGYAAARLLNLAGRCADVLFVGKHDHRTEQTALQAEIFSRYGGRELPDEASFKGYDLILDALFGIGLKREVIGRYADVIGAMNRVDTPVIAIDIPSGVSADSGQIMGCAVQADLTVTMQYEKLGQMLYPGAFLCGEILVRDVGITDDHVKWNQEPVYALEKDDLKDLISKRRPDANKGTYGKLLLIAGSKNMAGAAVLAGGAALRSGCGLVKVLSDEANRVILQTSLPEALFAPWPDEREMSGCVSAPDKGEMSGCVSAPDKGEMSGCVSVPDKGEISGCVSVSEEGDVTGHALSAECGALFEALSWADAVAVGPGLGQSRKSRDLLEYIIARWHGPLVIDADALNLIASDPELVRQLPPHAILTPHPGEMSRLSVHFEEGPLSINEILADPVTTAVTCARRFRCVSVLKGARSVITDSDQVFLNLYGNDGMATGGSGDVLTGIIGSLLAQGVEAADAAKAGVLLHALSGDEAAKVLGGRAMKAGDIVTFLSDILSLC